MPPVAPTSAVGSPPEAERTDRHQPLRRWPRRRWVLVAVALVTVLAVGLTLWRLGDGGAKPLTSADVDQAVQRGLEQAQADARATPPDATTAYRTISPSLVTVTTGGSRTSSTAPPDGDGSGLGAGVVINAQGSVLTALHVVQGSEQIRVQFADGTEAAARIESSQAATDIAVLAVDRLPEVVVPAVMGGVPPIGDDVFAVGHPLGLKGSLTAGVISANDRSIRTESGVALAGLIQFDAAVNPGNSGGPLLNRGGQVVGIVTALANPSKQAYFVGIGFAVPIATAAGLAGGPQQ